MTKAIIPLKAQLTNNENLPPTSLQRTNSQNKLTQLIQSNNTIRSGLSTRTNTPRKPLGQKSVNTLANKDIKKLKDTTNQKENMKSPSESNIISRRMPKEPTISFALPVTKSNSIDSDIFVHVDTPVHTLPTDCLIIIFEYCKDFETYCTLLGVCRRWRYIISQPFFWKHTDIQWTTLSKQITLLHRSRRHFEQLEYIRKLTIRHHDKTVICNPLTDIVKIAPYRNLKELHFFNVDLTDIAFLTSWLKHIKVLTCRNMHVSRGRMNFSIFAELDQLESLQLHCAERTPFGQAYFTSLRNTIEGVYPKKLPSSLKSLSIWNVYDCEEILDITASNPHRDFEEGILTQSRNSLEQLLHDWSQREDQLVSKYQMLTPLTNLESLALGRVSSFTSRVWRECLTPCAKKLEYLSMSMWGRSGNRESPRRLLRLQRQRSNSEENHALPYDVDMAIAEFISSMENIKKIKLDRFVCVDGVIDGIQKLGRKYTLTCKDNLEYKDIRDCRNIILYKTIIEFHDA